MTKVLRPSLFYLLALVLISFRIDAQEGPTFLYGDPLPDAPELATRGAFSVGVRSMELLHKDQIDILNYKEGEDPIYDRPLKVEVWYPAIIGEGKEELVTYEGVLGTANNPERPLIPFNFQGRALRDAPIDKADKAYPLIIVSHGYVGSRLLMTYLTENLASKGYVVMAIDHTESTYRDANGFQSTLLNRAKDIDFVLEEATNMAKDEDHFLFGSLDSDRVGLIGYSMGGFGVLNVGGAGYSDFAVGFFKNMTGGSEAIATLGVNHPDFVHKKMDPRIKAIVAFAPWGMANRVWDETGLANLQAPTLFVAGSQDDISGYENGIKAIYEGAVNVDRYLLTYKNARHNVAPNPPPPASLQPGLDINEYYRFAEPAWDMRRINNINQHFLTVFLGIHLQEKEEEYQKFLDINEDSNTKTWTGFVPRSSTGLELLHAAGKD